MPAPHIAATPRPTLPQAVVPFISSSQGTPTRIESTARTYGPLDCRVTGRTSSRRSPPRPNGSTNATGKRRHSTLGMRSPIDCELAEHTDSHPAGQRSRSRRGHCPTVLTGVNAKPYGRPTASPDPSCGRQRPAITGTGQEISHTITIRLVLRRSLNGHRGIANSYAHLGHVRLPITSGAPHPFTQLKQSAPAADG
jgi:hypothetical protein